MSKEPHSAGMGNVHCTVPPDEQFDCPMHLADECVCICVRVVVSHNSNVAFCLILQSNQQSR